MKIINIRSPLIDNYTRIIKNLAAGGRNLYSQYLIKPLSQWSDRIPAESIEKLKGLIKQAEDKGSKRLPLIYKMAIIKSTSPNQFDLSIPGNIAIDFLQAMRFSSQIARSDEALEFFNLLKTPFKEFSDIEFKHVNRLFVDEIDNKNDVEVEKLLTTHDEVDTEKERISKIANSAIEDIEKVIIDQGNIKKAAISFILKFANASDPNRHAGIDKIFEIMHGRNNLSFRKEVLDSTAIIIYQEILKNIQTGQLNQAIKHIGKYTIIFKGNPETPNFLEVDLFEKKLFEIIDSKNLWDKI